MNGWERNMDNKAHDKIMEEFNKQIKAAYVRGIIVGHKLGSNYVAEKLGTRNQWEDMSKSELISLLSQGLAMNNAIQNGTLKINTDNISEDLGNSEVDNGSK